VTVTWGACIANFTPLNTFIWMNRLCVQQDHSFWIKPFTDRGIYEAATSGTGLGISL